MLTENSTDDPARCGKLPGIRAVREMIAKHRSRLDRSEREFRLWQARWSTREREISAQMQLIADHLRCAETDFECASSRPALTVFPPSDGAAVELDR